MDLGISGKVAVVAAASKGLGRASALELARAGCNVAICARDDAGITAAARAIADETGATVLPFVADMTSAGDIASFVAAAAEQLGDPQILVANAGGPPAGSFDQFDDAAWEKAFQLTEMSTVRLIRAVLPFMRKTGWGRIITITSISAKQPIDNLLLSNAIRPGVVGLVKTLSTQLAPEGITVNNVAPGSILTDRQYELQGQRAKREGISVEEAIAASGKTIPIGRIGEPEELGALVAFLASARASYITGQTIAVDGGSGRGLF
ncbi:MAG TPA: SDR family oxidoreductase [Roseiflexaceae bacterium]|nr:SDR family oxidoreductase [Roseiflexaceae bacterium]